MAKSGPLRFIAAHPLGRRHPVQALSRFALWQLRSRVDSGMHRVGWVGGLELCLRRGDHGLTGNLYCGLHEFWEMAFVLHYLGPYDLFLDIGANLGSYTLLASGIRQAETLSVEPVPRTFERLVENVRANQLQERVTMLNVGLAADAGMLTFSDLGDSTINRVLPEDEAGDGIDVEVMTLDDIVGDSQPALIKLDVEGYEPEVLRGAQDTLARFRPAVLMETLGDGAAGRLLTDLGYSPFTYEPFSRSLGPGHGTHNTLFLQDAGAAARRLQVAPPVEVFGERF